VLATGNVSILIRTPRTSLRFGCDISLNDNGVGGADKPTRVKAVDSYELVEAESNRVSVVQGPLEGFGGFRRAHGLAEVVPLPERIVFVLQKKMYLGIN
jgi:hypothetical protein